jgi:3-oxoacyl-[acyl-carrier-protein] synthase II
MGVVSPLGTTIEKSWETLLGGGSGATSLEEALLLQDLAQDQFDREWKIAKTLPCQVAAPVKGLHEAFVGDMTGGDRNPRTTARFVQMALLAGSQALQEADLLDWLSEDAETDNEIGAGRRDRFGVCVGSGMSSVRDITSAWDQVVRDGKIRRLSPHFVPRVLANSAAGRLGLEFGLRGPNLAPSTACAASAHALGDALNAIRNGNCDLMLAGGAEASIEPLGMAGFCRLRALSTAFNDTPQEASRPFDDRRDGFVMGEGAAVLVLEELEHAKQRLSSSNNSNARILAEVTGYAATGDAFHVTAPDEAGRGAERAMQLALQEDRSGLEPVPLGYVNAHATSTPKGDQIEASVVDRVLRSTNIGDDDAESTCYLSSTKGVSGHLLGAAGALEAAFTVRSLFDQRIPPTANLSIPPPSENDNDETLFTHVAGTQALEPASAVELAVSNSFGFGGTNASLVFRRYTDDAENDNA